jgi:MIP family channel proteins
MSESMTIEISTPTNNYRNSHVVRDTNYLTCPNSLVKESLFEFFGMYLFITLSLGNVALTNLYPEANANWTGVSISWGLNLMFGIYLASFKSPAHLNPAVSLCMYFFKKSITFKQLVWYTVSQFLGAFVAAATVYGIYYNKLGSEDKYSNIFTTSANYAITDYTAWFTEFLGTALLVGGIFMLVDHKSTKNNVPIYAGLWLSTLVFSFGFQTAFAWNPARDLGPRVFATCAGYASFSYTDYYFWVPLTADYLGALFGVAFYEYLIKPNTN